MRRAAAALAPHLVALGLAACAPAVVSQHLADGRTGTITFSTVSPTSGEFATGHHPARTVVVTGDLTLPRGASGRVPAVVLIHGSSGVGRNMPGWVGALTSLGVATFVVDSFTGRGISETATDQSRVSSGAMIVDAYRALALLATHPGIDPRRIAVMGFSKGGYVALYSSLDRFQRIWGPSGVRFAAHLPFYPSCNIRLLEETRVNAPIRIFHGEADDWTRIGPCRAYVERLREAGADAHITGYPGAHHGFDVPRPPGEVRLRDVQNGSGCDLVERTPGVAFHRDTDTRAVPGDPCVGRGATAAYDPRAHRASIVAVKEFLSTTFLLTPK